VTRGQCDRTARWYVCIPKIAIWENVEGY
jgi:hypothetical protein